MSDLIRKSDARKAVQYHVTDDDDRNTLSRAIATLPAVTVGVKPLVWEEDGLGNFRAEGVYGREGIDYLTHSDGTFAQYYVWGDAFPYPTIEAAKAAAQADYEARILAALEPVAAPDHEAMLEWISSFPPPNEKLREMYAKYQSIIKSGRLTVTQPDPAAIREAALREAIDHLIDDNEFEAAELILALIQKGAADDR